MHVKKINLIIIINNINNNMKISDVRNAQMEIENIYNYRKQVR